MDDVERLKLENEHLRGLVRELKGAVLMHYLDYVAKGIESEYWSLETSVKAVKDYSEMIDGVFNVIDGNY